MADSAPDVYKRQALVGLVRVVTEVQTNAYYSVVKDQPTHQYSTCNYGKGFRLSLIHI